MTTEAEDIFFDKIHCNYPYYDKDACFDLIEEASTLSDNAMFTVIEEICRIPFSDKENVPIDFMLDMLMQTKAKLNHPLKEMVLETACRIVKKEDLTVDEAISRMQTIRKYKGQYSALSILYFSCNDTEDKLDSIWESIIKEWNGNTI